MKYYFYDLGAFDGKETLEMIKIFNELNISDYEIHCFEPSSSSYLNMKHCLTNACVDERVKCHKVAISQNQGTIKLYHSVKGNEVGHSVFSTKCNVNQDDFEEVKSTVFSTWLNDNIKDFDTSFNILKFNIEGAEYFLLKDLIEHDLINNFHILCGDAFDILKIGELQSNIKDHMSNVDSLNNKIFEFSAQGNMTHKMKEEMKNAILSR